MSMLGNAIEKLVALVKPAPVSLAAALSRCRRRIPQVGTLLDVGASNGSWSVFARRHFPEMDCFMIEAQKEHEPALLKLKRNCPSCDYLIAAAGDCDGLVHFQEGDLFGGIATHSPAGHGYRQVPMVALDSVVKDRLFSPPFLLKLDTHGFEVPILEGAQDTLNRTVLLVVEVYNFQLTPQSLRFHEIIAYLESRGFRCVDICDPLFRKDGVLWQMDLFFMRTDAEAFNLNSYF